MALAGATSGALYNPSCVERLPLDGTISDASGYGNNATSTNGTYTTGGARFGQGQYFVAASSQFIDNGTQLNSYISATPSSWTTAYWVKHKAGVATEQVEVSSHSDISNTGFYITYVPASSVIVGVVGLGGTFAGAIQVSSAATITTDQWYHVALTVSGNSASLYINGNLQQTNTGTRYSMGNHAGNMRIGRNLSAANYCQAVFDDVHFYRTPLPQSDIKRIMYGLHPLYK